MLIIACLSENETEIVKNLKTIIFWFFCKEKIGLSEKKLGFFKDPKCSNESVEGYQFSETSHNFQKLSYFFKQKMDLSKTDMNVL